MISRLKINLKKSTILGVGLDSYYVIQIATDLGCRMTSLPLSYLGLPLGGRVLDCNSLNHVVEIFRFKLAL